MTTPLRRRWLGRLPVLLAGLGGGAASARAAAAANASTHAQPHFPGDPPQHQVVYQLNQAGADYIAHIQNSVGALIGKYEDNVAIVVVAFGPGLHLLARRPGRPVAKSAQTRARTQAQDYGVRYIACGNTLKTLGWTAADLVDFAEVHEVGAATLMELQQQGYAYIAW